MSLPKYASLDHRIVEKDLTVYTAPRGPSLVGKSISIQEFLHDRMLNEAFDGPLTDYECSDQEDVTSDKDTEHPNPLLPPAPSPSSEFAPGGLATPPTRLCKQKDRSLRRRRARRVAKQTAENTDLKEVSKKRRIEATKDALQLDFDVGVDVKVTRPGWIGKRVDDLPKREFTKEEILEVYGLTYFPWNGKTTHLLLDREKHVVGALVGRPRDSAAWDEVHSQAFEVLKLAASKLTYTDKETSHRRGRFPAVAHGISFGGGQEVPQHLCHGTKKDRMLDRLMEEPSIQRICSFASGAFQSYSERNYNYMKTTMESLRAESDSATNPKFKLRKPYDAAIGVFPCRSLNLGEQSISFPHTDKGNLAQSMCSITPLGSFNPRTGGHIVLWDFGLIIEFPAGSTIFIPSALIQHSNTSIKHGEVRYSIIQYAAGGLYRWVQNGFMSEQSWLAKASKIDLEGHRAEQESRWAEAVKMFTRLDELEGKKEEVKL